MAELALALWQSAAQLNGVDERLEWLAAQLARDPAAELLLLPELFLSGYALAPAGWRAAAARTPAALGRVGELARRHRTAIALGYPEASAGALYNSACVIDADGRRRLAHRKRLLPPGAETAAFAVGDTAPAVIEIAGVRISMLICYEVEFPELVRDCARAGAELLLVPTALVQRWTLVARQLIPTRAFENNCFIAYANHAGCEGAAHYLGESCIAGPDGACLARAGAAPARIAAPIDSALISPLRRRLPYLRDSATLADR